MPAQAYYQDDDFGFSGARDAADFLRAVSAFRDEVDADERDFDEASEYEVWREHDAKRPRRGRSGEYWQEEAGRIREEIDHLVRMYEAASGRRSEPRRTRPRRRPEARRARPNGEDAWLKKMFMFMMLAELV
jgi:hypothetical protein